MGLWHPTRGKCVFCVGQVLELGSSLQISKLACGLVLGLRALMGANFEV